MGKYETYTVADIAVRLGKSEQTVRKYIRDGKLGQIKKLSAGMYKIPAGAIGALIIAQEKEAADAKRQRDLQDASSKKTRDKKKKNLLFVPRYKHHEAVELAKERMEEEAQKHEKAWERDLTNEEIEFRKTRIERAFLYQLLSETDSIPRESLSESEKRVALKAPIFMMDILSRLDVDDVSFFLAELQKYYDLGYEIDDDPRVSFTVSQIIFEQINLLHRQTLSLAQEYSIDKDLDDAMGRSMARIANLFKTLKEYGTPAPPPKDKDTNGLGAGGQEML